MKGLRSVAAAAGMFVGLCLSSQATILLPGQSGLDASQAPGPAPIATLGFSPFVSIGGVVGGVKSWVVRDPANPLGGLSFYYQIGNSGVGGLGSLSIPDFGIIPGAPVEVSTIVAPFDSSLPGGILPSDADRSGGSGDVVSFNFFGGLSRGMSVLLVVNTSFQDFGVTTGSIDHGVSAVTVPFVLAPVPEPATWIVGALLLLPLGLSAFRILRKG